MTDTTQTPPPIDIPTAEAHANAVLAQYRHQVDALMATKPLVATIMVSHEMMLTGILGIAAKVALQVGAKPEAMMMRLCQASMGAVLDDLKGVPEDQRANHKRSQIIIPGGKA